MSDGWEAALLMKARLEQIKWPDFPTWVDGPVLPVTLPPGSATRGVEWEPSGTYLATSGGVTGVSTFKWYENQAGSIVKLADPTPLDGQAGAVGWDPTGTLLLVGGNNATADWLVLYQRTGVTLARLADPDQPSTRVNDIRWSADGTHVAVATQGAPYLRVYSVSGTTLTKLADPATPPAGQVRGVAITADGSTIVVSSQTAPFISSYSRVGGTLTRLALPADLAGGGVKLDITPDEDLVAVASFSADRLSLYALSPGGVLSRITDPPQPPSGTNDAKWSGDILAVSYASEVAMYQRTPGTQTLVRLADKVPSPGALTWDLSWTPGATEVAVANQDGEGIEVQENAYVQTAEVVFAKVLVSAGIDLERTRSQVRWPFCLILPADMAVDEEAEDLVTQRYSVLIAQRVANDPWGETVLIGGAGPGTGTTSRGRGLMELERALFDALALLSEQDGILVQITSASAIAAELDPEIGYVAQRVYTFEALVGAGSAP